MSVITSTWKRCSGSSVPPVVCRRVHEPHQNWKRRHPLSIVPRPIRLTAIDIQPCPIRLTAIDIHFQLYLVLSPHSVVTTHSDKSTIEHNILYIIFSNTQVLWCLLLLPHKNDVRVRLYRQLFVGGCTSYLGCLCLLAHSGAWKPGK
jgi:hypothetical protein